MNPPIRHITIQQPRTLVFGVGAIEQCVRDLAARKPRSAFIVTSPPTRQYCEALTPADANAHIWDEIRAEPTIDTLRAALSAARDARADCVIGLGGGSALDVAKLVAALLGNTQDIRDVFGIGKLVGRSTYVACLPTTAGTGSEVSPNAILLDEDERLKKGVISPHLVPDAAYVDPNLTLSVPPDVTAATGMDALTHCIEAYASKFAHPLIDIYAIHGIKLIGRSLARAVANGKDIDARSDVALGSLYGGICLGPVNTGAVHALAYPLGSEFKIAHGVSNAVLLPHVLEFNLSAAPDRYRDIARAVTAAPERDCKDPDLIATIKNLSKSIGIPQTLRELNIPESAIEPMARSAMTITRLLERNVREVTLRDAIEIYRRAF